MNIEVVDIKSIKANPSNPRFIKDEAFEKLVKSIKEFPKMLEIRPIVVNADMVALGGNMRLKACKEAGLKKIPIIRVEDLTKDQQDEFIIKDNLGYGEWDWEVLNNEWDADELKDWGLEMWKEEEFDDEEEEEQEGGGKDYQRKKVVMLEMAEEDYHDMLDVIRFWKDRGKYVGEMCLKYLKAEERKISKNPF